MKVNLYMQTPVRTGFKGVREDRNTVSQLKENNNYSLTEPNQRRIDNAIDSLSKQRGEENIKFLLDVGENLKYQTNIHNDNIKIKNDWSEKLKNAVNSSLAISDPILTEKYGSKIKDVFNPKPLNKNEAYLVQAKNILVKSVEGDKEADNIKKNLEYFIESTETPIEQKKYVMKRLKYFMSPKYSINPQLKDKKPQILSEISNDIAINTQDKDIPNTKAVNQKTHGMCAAISIVRKAVAYEDKPNFVDAILSELDDTDNVMIYDKQNLGSGKRIPVKKTWIDYDYAQERGYRIIDASTLQWMNIAGMYGTHHENLQEFNAFDKNNFDAFHDAFFLKNFDNNELITQQAYYQVMTKAEEDIKGLKKIEIKRDIKTRKRMNNKQLNIHSLELRNNELKEIVKDILPNVSKDVRKTAVNDVIKFYQPLSMNIKKLPRELQEYTFIPNEEDSQKQKKIEKYFKDRYPKEIDKDNLTRKSMSLVNNLTELNNISNDMSGNAQIYQKVARARKFYEAEAVYRAAISVGMTEKDIRADKLVYYNIPDRETRISDGFADVIDRINNKNDKKLLEHFSKYFDTTPDDKDKIVSGLMEVKNVVDYLITSNLDEMYRSLGFGSRRELLVNDITDSINDIQNNDKSELNRVVICLGIDKNSKDKKSIVLDKLNSLLNGLEEHPQNEKLYIDAYNKMGNKDQTDTFIEVYKMFSGGIAEDSELRDVYIAKFKEANNLDETTSENDVLEVLKSIGDNFNYISETLNRAGNMLEVMNDDGSPYYTVNATNLVLKKMENEGELIPRSTMKKLQTRFAKIDKLRSSDEFSSRQGKISDPSLYKFSKEESDAIKQIDKKLDKMYAYVKRERNYEYNRIKNELEGLAQYVGTNSGNYWVQKEGDSGLYHEQQIKIFDELTDRPHKEVTDLYEATDIIKTTPHSGVSSSNVFHDRYGSHAMYVADVVKDEHTGKEIILHDNSWGASEHENTWIDSDGNIRTDYSDNRGGELGYITDKDWRNGNFVENLTHKKGHISPDNTESKIYKKINPNYNDENDFSLMSGIILEGKTIEYRDIAGTIKDEIFIPDAPQIKILEKHAKNMTKQEIKAAIFKNNSILNECKQNYEKIIKRITPTEFNKGITTEDEYNSLDDNDPVKIVFEKAAIRNAFEDATMYKELGEARTMDEVKKIKAKQHKKAKEDFYYTFNKNSATQGVFLAAAHNHGTDFSEAISKSLQKYGIVSDSEVLGKVIHNLALLEGDEKSKYDGSVKNSINIFMEKASKQFDENLGNIENADLVKAEFLNNLNQVYEKNIYFNKEDLKSDTVKQKGIRMWIDDTFNPKTDEEFVKIFRMLQDMPKKEFYELTEKIDDKYLGIKDVSGYDLLTQVQNANSSATDLLKNIIFYDVFSDTIDLSKTKKIYKLKKLERNSRGVVYQGTRTFDDLYRTFRYSLSNLEYEKQFNKYKGAAFREHGVMPAYPKISLDNDSFLNSRIDSTESLVNDVFDTISNNKNMIYNMKLVHLLDEYRQSVPNDRPLNEIERSVISRMSGDFISANLLDEDMKDALNSAYEILELDSNSKIEDYNPYIDNIVNIIKMVENANTVDEFESANKSHFKSLSEYFNTIINSNIPPKYHRIISEDVKNWLALEKASRKEANGIDKNREVLELQLKLMQNLKNISDKKGVIEGFVEISNALNKAKSSNFDKEKDALDKNLQIFELHKISDKYLEKYVNQDAIPNLRANINDWYRKELFGGEDKKFDEQALYNARNKFSMDFKKHHLTSHPTEVLENFLLFSAADAEPTKKQSIYRQYLETELNFAKFISIQDALMEAVKAGNAAHVKEYFNEYNVAVPANGGEVVTEMDSDLAIDYMLRSMLLEDNLETATMFVEKLGLAERAMNLERKIINALNPNQKIDDIAKILTDANEFTESAMEACKPLLQTVDDIESSKELDKAIINAKKDILKSLEYSDDKKSKKIFTDALNDARRIIKEKPEITKSAVIASKLSSAVSDVNRIYNNKIESIQDDVKIIHMLYRFLEGIHLSDNSKEKALQAKISKEHSDFTDYNNRVLRQAIDNTQNAVLVMD